MKFSYILSVFILLSVVEKCYCYRILAIYGLSIRSHFIFINEVLNGLVQKGHKVDLVSVISHNEAHPNYTQIIKLPERITMTSNGLTYDEAHNVSKSLVTIATHGSEICENIGNPDFLKLAYNPPNDPPYDLIISHMMHYTCITIYGHLWNIPVVLISTTSLYPWMHDAIANPENIAISSNNLQVDKSGNNFWGRLLNFNVFYYYKFNYIYNLKRQDDVLKKYYGENAPTAQQLERNVSLILMNSYFPLNGVKPMTKALVEIGGVHIQNKGPELTENLKNWLDESTDGVIYFSFGSMIRIETSPEETLRIMFKTFRDLAPTRILIRMMDPKVMTVKVPNNVFISAWLPQQRVLQHPNVRLFITHGGLLGTQESIYYGVPMLCIPFFADQFTNAYNYVDKKIAVMIDISKITQEIFDNALNEVLNNPIYRDNMKRLSRLFKDRPQSSMDTAIFWIEYVIRNGKDSLRSSAMDLTWWQVSLLDIYAAIFGALVIILLLTILLAKKIISLLLIWKRYLLKEKEH